MATLFFDNGVDLSSIYEPIRGTTAISGTRFFVAVSGSDISTLFMSKALTGLPSVSGVASGFVASGIDIGSLFQPLGYAPGTTSRVSITTVGSGTWYASSLDAAVGYRVKNIAVRCCAGGGIGSGGGNVGGGGGGFLYSLVDVSNGSASYNV